MKADRAARIDRRISLVAGDKLRPDSEHVAPTFDPRHWIAPMPFRGESDLGQRRRVIGPGSGDVHQGDCGLQKARKATKSLAPSIWDQGKAHPSESCSSGQVSPTVLERNA